MKFLIDSASPESVKKILEYYPAEGVTTNPTIICRENCDFKKTLLAMREVLGSRMLHVQTMQTKAGEMVKEAEALHALLGGEFYVKLPATPEGLKACRILKDKGIGVTVTAVFAPMQALLAARAGADFVAPYVNKLDDVGYGEECVEKIVNLFKEFSLPTKVLSASFRNVEQVTRVALAGSHYITLPVPFYEKLIRHPMTDGAIRGFEDDWQRVYGGVPPIELIK